MPVEIDFSAPVSCFRVPLHHNFHRSFPLPPPTAVIGLLGAAMGLHQDGIDVWLREARPELAIGGEHDGGGKELMTVRKVKSGGKVIAKEYSTVLLRELRTELRCKVVVKCSTLDQDRKLCKAVNEPLYPFSAGPADFLALARARYSDSLRTEPASNIRKCIAPGALWGKAKIDPKALKGSSLLETVAGPNSWNLPVVWALGKKGERLPARLQPFTFLTTAVMLREPVSCVRVHAKFDTEPLDLPWLGIFDKWLVQ